MTSIAFESSHAGSLTEDLTEEDYKKSTIHRSYLQEYQLSNALEKTIRKMKKMEVCEMMLRSFEEVAYGQDFETLAKHFEAKGLQFSDEFFKDPAHWVKYTVQLYFFAEGKHLYTIKFDERKTFVARKRELGAKLIKAEKFKRAVKVLETQIEYASLGIYAEDKASFKADLLSGYLNCSLCFWKLEKWAKMRMAAEKALETDPTSVKAAYRKAFALRKQQEYEHALKFIEENPHLASEELTVLKGHIEVDLKEHRRKEKEMFKNILGKPKKE